MKIVSLQTSNEYIEAEYLNQGQGSEDIGELYALQLLFEENSFEIKLYNHDLFPTQEDVFQISHDQPRSPLSLADIPDLLPSEIAEHLIYPWCPESCSSFELDRKDAVHRKSDAQRNVILTQDLEERQSNGDHHAYFTPQARESATPIIQLEALTTESLDRLQYESMLLAAIEVVPQIFDGGDDDNATSDDGSLDGSPYSTTPLEDCPCRCGGPKGACRSWTRPPSPLHRVMQDSQGNMEHLWIGNPQAVLEEEEMYLEKFVMELQKRLEDVSATEMLPRCMLKPMCGYITPSATDCDQSDDDQRKGGETLLPLAYHNKGDCDNQGEGERVELLLTNYNGRDVESQGKREGAKLPHTDQNEGDDDHKSPKNPRKVGDGSAVCLMA